MVVTKRKKCKMCNCNAEDGPTDWLLGIFFTSSPSFFLFGESKQFQTKPGSRTVIRINVEINHNFFRSPDNDLYANVGT